MKAYLHWIAYIPHHRPPFPSSFYYVAITKIELLFIFVLRLCVHKDFILQRNHNAPLLRYLRQISLSCLFPGRGGALSSAGAGEYRRVHEAEEGTWGYRRVQECTGRYWRVHEVHEVQEGTGGTLGTRGYRRVHEGTGGCKKIQEGTWGKWDSGGYWRYIRQNSVQVGTGGYRRVKEGRSPSVELKEGYKAILYWGVQTLW